MPTLSEAESKSLLAAHGVPFAPERLVNSPQEAVDAASELGLPVVAKLCGDHIAHKTERGLVRLGLASEDAVADATRDLLEAARPEDSATGVLIAPMVRGHREFIAGLSDDPQFGMTVVVGIGGILAEAVADVAIRLVPITRDDAEDMIGQLSCSALLGEFRGEAAVDREGLIDTLLALSAAAEATPGLRSVDLNPVIIAEGGRPVAVDALVELDDTPGAPS